MNSEKSNHIDIDKKQLERLSKSQLINMLLQSLTSRPPVPAPRTYIPRPPVPTPRTYKPRPPVPTPKPSAPVPTPLFTEPRKGVRQMIKDYEANIILPSKTHKSKPSIPAPPLGVRQMIKNYEANRIRPTVESRAKPSVLTPKTCKPRPPVPAPRTNKQKPPVPAPRTQVKRVDKALKGFTESYEIGIKNNRDPLVQLQHTRKYIGHLLIKTLRLLQGY